MFAALVTGGNHRLYPVSGKTGKRIWPILPAKSICWGISLLFSLAVAGMCFCFAEWWYTGLYGSAEPEVLRQAMIYFCFPWSPIRFDDAGQSWRHFPFHGKRHGRHFPYPSLWSIINIVLNAVFILAFNGACSGPNCKPFLAWGRQQRSHLFFFIPS